MDTVTNETYDKIMYGIEPDRPAPPEKWKAWRVARSVLLFFFISWLGWAAGAAVFAASRNAEVSAAVALGAAAAITFTVSFTISSVVPLKWRTFRE